VLCFDQDGSAEISIMWNALSGSIAALLLPSHLLTAVIFLGVVLLAGRFKQLGWQLIVIGCAVLVAVGILPIGNALIFALEQRFPDWSGTVQPTAIIVVQGSNYSGLDFTQTESGLLARSAANIAVPARRFPQTPIHYVTTDAAQSDNAKMHAESLQKLIQSFGLSSDQVKIDYGPANLADIAKFLKDSLVRNASDRWLLVTPAIEMPLLIGSFRRQNLPVEAYPTDRRIRERKDFLPGSIPAGIVRLDIAVYEWAGLLSNWLMGQTSELLPS
jgi:uncharacterized SAM-binding protein YcdF (DUF218 family)